MTARTSTRLRQWRRIPPNIKEDIDEVARFTKRTGREGSITMGEKRGRIFSCQNFKGTATSTESPPCDTAFGDAQRIGDVHSHPVTTDTVGVVPSPSDITSTMTDSAKHKRAQTSCITSHKTPLIVCYEPKIEVDNRKAREYVRARNNYNRTNSERYYANNVENDFDFALYDRQSGVRQNKPPANKVIDAAFGDSKKGLRKDVEPLGRDQWCEYTTGTLMGQAHRRDVIQACKAELAKRSILGIEY
jgi:hypothetical protein